MVLTEKSTRLAVRLSAVTVASMLFAAVLLRFCPCDPSLCRDLSLSLITGARSMAAILFSGCIAAEFLRLRFTP